MNSYQTAGNMTCEITTSVPEPFAHCAGPRTASLVVVGEAWGESEERNAGIPFCGASGHEFSKMLIETGWDDSRGTLARAVEAFEAHRFGEWLSLREEWLHNADIMLTNVFALRPISNNLGYLCASKGDLGDAYNCPPVRTENPRYVKTEYLSHLSRLREEVRAGPRNLLLCLGGTATWAMVGSSAIGRLRGAVCQSRDDAPMGLGGVKCLPTFHPAAIFRAWHWRVIVLADLLKARREREFPEVHRPLRSVIINPSLDQIETWVEETLRGSFTLLSPDIETMNGQIRCIGFARRRDESIVIPFISDLTGKSYWNNIDDEVMAWSYVQNLLDCPLPKIFQNGLFDLQYLIRAGLTVRNARHDTMLLHHVLYPEMQKSLGFLGSIYTNEMSWKLMRLHKGAEELKRDE